MLSDNITLHEAVGGHLLIRDGLSSSFGTWDRWLSAMCFLSNSSAAPLHHLQYLIAPYLQALDYVKI